MHAKFFRFLFLICFVLISFNGHGAETNDLLCLPDDARQVWFAGLTSFNVTNVTFREACRIIENESRKEDSREGGISIVDIRKPHANTGDQPRITFNNERGNVVSALLNCLALAQGREVSSPEVRFLGRSAIVGDKEVIVIAYTLVMECLDGKTKMPINDVVLTPLMHGVFNTNPKVGLVDNKKMFIWTVQLLVPVMVGAGATSTFVDKDIWEKGLCYKVSAKGYDDKICQQTVFGSCADGNYVSVELTKAESRPERDQRQNETGTGGSVRGQ